MQRSQRHHSHSISVRFPSLSPVTPPPSVPSMSDCTCLSSPSRSECAANYQALRMPIKGQAPGARRPTCPATPPPITSPHHLLLLAQHPSPCRPCTAAWKNHRGRPQSISAARHRFAMEEGPSGKLPPPGCPLRRAEGTQPIFILLQSLEHLDGQETLEPRRRYPVLCVVEPLPASQVVIVSLPTGRAPPVMPMLSPGRLRP
jgi:hypothetical protein